MPSKLDMPSVLTAALVVAVYFLPSEALPGLSPKLVNMLSMYACEGYDQVVHIYDTSIFKKNRKEYVMNAKIDYKEDIAEDAKWDMQVKADWQRENDPQSKRTMFAVNMTDICSELKKDKPEFAAFFGAFRPTIGPYCPFHKGSYTLEEFRQNWQGMETSLPDGTWIITIEETVNGKHTSCNIIKFLVKS